MFGGREPKFRAATCGIKTAAAAEDVSPVASLLEGPVGAVLRCAQDTVEKRSGHTAT